MGWDCLNCGGNIQDDQGGCVVCSQDAELKQLRATISSLSAEAQNKLFQAVKDRDTELTRLRARIEELEARNIELVGRMTALGQHHALRAAERRVAELERAIWRVRKRFQAFPGDDDESDVFWAAIRLLFAALDAAEGEA